MASTTTDVVFSNDHCIESSDPIEDVVRAFNSGGSDNLISVPDKDGDPIWINRTLVRAVRPHAE
jgi:hypothetical protein